MKITLIVLSTLIATAFLFSRDKSVVVPGDEIFPQKDHKQQAARNFLIDRKKIIENVDENINQARLNPTNVYTIRCVQNGKVVEVEDGIGEKGRKVQQYFQYEHNGIVDGKNQRWLIIPTNRRNTPSFFIINYGFLNYMNGADPVQAFSGGPPLADNDLWQFQPAGAPDTYFIKLADGVQFLQIPEGNNENGTRLSVNRFTGGRNQMFEVVKYQGLPRPTDYRTGSLVNIAPVMNTSKTIQVSNASGANGAAIQLFDIRDGAQNEHWQLVPTIDGYFNLKPRHSANKCADIADWNGGINIRILSWDCSPVEKQKWLIIPVPREPGNHIIINKVSGLCLDVANASSANGTNIQLFEFFNQSNQKWKFLPAR